MSYTKYYSHKKGDSTHAYTNTRVRIMMTKLLNIEDYKLLTKMNSISEILHYLEEREFSEEISKLGLKKESIELLNSSLNLNLKNTFQKIMKFSIGKSLEQIEFYLKRYDVYNVKTILRGYASNESIEYITEQMVFAGKLNKEYFTSLYQNSKNLDELKSKLSSLDFCSGIAELKDQDKIEDLLDRNYFTNAAKFSEKNVKVFLEKEIDFVNAKNFLRLKKTGITNTQSYMMKTSTKRYYKKAIQEKENPDAQKILFEEFLHKGLRLTKYYGTNISPILGYFVAKENEIRNIRIIARGKKFDIEEKELLLEVVC